jgi:hypothetical protein
MTTSRRPIRRVGALAVALTLGALALGGCTPSNLELETRTTRSAFKALTGRPATGEVTCSLELVSEDGPDDEYGGSCVVHGQSFRMQAFYAVSPSYSTAFLSAAVPRGNNRLFRHSCTFVKSGSKPWKLNSSCRTGEIPGF